MVGTPFHVGVPSATWYHYRAKPDYLSPRLLGKLVGNAFTQPVIEQICLRLLTAAGLAGRRDLNDRFARK